MPQGTLYLILYQYFGNQYSQWLPKKMPKSHSRACNFVGLKCQPSGVDAYYWFFFIHLLVLFYLQFIAWGQWGWWLSLGYPTSITDTQDGNSLSVVSMSYVNHSFGMAMLSSSEYFPDSCSTMPKGSANALSNLKSVRWLCAFRGHSWVVPDERWDFLMQIGLLFLFIHGLLVYLTCQW